MRRRLIILVCLLLCTLTIIGCSNNTLRTSHNLGTAFRTLVPADDMNKSLRIEAELQNQEANESRDTIRVSIQNLSDEYILLRQPEDIMLLVRSGNDWVQIQNAIEYFGNGEGPTLFPATVDRLRSHATTAVRPVLDAKVGSATTKALLRIVILGEILSDGGNSTGVTAAAYTDLLLDPP
jgi:hypothetical protein